MLPRLTCRKKRHIPILRRVGKTDRLLSEKPTRLIEEDRSGKIGIDPPPPTPATASPGGGGGDSLIPEPAPAAPAAPAARYPATIALLAKAGLVTAGEFGDLAPEVAQAALDQAARHPAPRNGVAALAASLLRQAQAGTWHPAEVAASADRAPSDLAIITAPISPQLRADLLARFRAAATPDAKRAVMERLHAALAEGNACGT